MVTAQVPAPERLPWRCPSVPGPGRYPGFPSSTAKAREPAPGARSPPFQGHPVPSPGRYPGFRDSMTTVPEPVAERLPWRCPSVPVPGHYPCFPSSTAKAQEPGPWARPPQCRCPPVPSPGRYPRYPSSVSSAQDPGRLRCWCDSDPSPGRYLGSPGSTAKVREPAAWAGSPRCHPHRCPSLGRCPGFRTRLSKRQAAPRWRRSRSEREPVPGHFRSQGRPELRGPATQACPGHGATRGRYGPGPRRRGDDGPPSIPRPRPTAASSAWHLVRPTLRPNGDPTECFDRGSPQTPFVRMLPEATRRKPQVMAANGGLDPRGSSVASRLLTISKLPACCCAKFEPMLISPAARPSSRSAARFNGEASSYVAVSPGEAEPNLALPKSETSVRSPTTADTPGDPWKRPRLTRIESQAGGPTEAQSAC